MYLDAAYEPPANPISNSFLPLPGDSFSMDSSTTGGNSCRGRALLTFLLIRHHRLLQQSEAHTTIPQLTSSLPSGPRRNFKAFRCNRTVLRSLVGPSPCALSIICSKRPSLLQDLAKWTRGLVTACCHRCAADKRWRWTRLRKQARTRTRVTQPPVLAQDRTSAVLPIRYVEVL